MERTALVTGASRGIGRAACLALAQQGYKVLCLARSRPELEELAASRPGLVALPLDLTKGEELDSALDAALREHGPVTVLVNNAGYGLRGAIEELPLDECRRLFEVNLFSLLRVTQKVLPGMRAMTTGTIINISSIAGLASNPFGGIYCASKFALEAATDALRLEVKPWGIRVVLIEPGPVATHFTRAASEASDPILDNPDSPYAKYYAKLKDSVRWVHKGAIPAEAVADLIARVAIARKPKARYFACKPLFMLPALVRRFGPTWLLDSILTAKMGIQ